MTDSTCVSVWLRPAQLKYVNSLFLFSTDTATATREYSFTRSRFCMSVPFCLRVYVLSTPSVKNVQHEFIFIHIQID